MYINQIKELSTQFSKVIVPDRIKTFALDQQDAPKYQGTFNEILNMVCEGKIKLLTKGDQVYGISVNSGTGNVEMDNLAGQNFNSKYCCKDVMQMVKMAYALTIAGTIPDDTVETDGRIKIYLYQQGKVVDLYGNILAQLNEGETATFDNIREILDAKMSEKEPKRTYTHQDHSIDLPEEEEISLRETDGTLKSVRHYLKGKYHNCLEKGHKPTITKTGNTVKVTNIRWGRQMAQSEIDCLE